VPCVKAKKSPYNFHISNFICGNLATLLFGGEWVVQLSLAVTYQFPLDCIKKEMAEVKWVKRGRSLPFPLRQRSPLPFFFCGAN